MASIISVDTLQDSAGSNEITTANVKTAFDNSAKAWVNFNGTGTIAARDSFNVASLTDNGVGQYTVNFTNNMGVTDYCFQGSACTTSLQGTTIWCQPEQVSKFLTSSITVTVGYTNQASNARLDYEFAGVTIHGDLA